MSSANRCYAIALVLKLGIVYGIGKACPDIGCMWGLAYQAAGVWGVAATKLWQLGRGILLAALLSDRMAKLGTRMDGTYGMSNALEHVVPHSFQVQHLTISVLLLLFTACSQDHRLNIMVSRQALIAHGS